MINGNRPLNIAAKMNSDTGLNISFDTGYKSPSVGAQIGQFGLGLASVFLNAAICRAADPTTRGGSAGGGGGTTETKTTPEQEYKTGMNNLNMQIAAKQGQIAYLESQCATQEQITEKENDINKLKEDLDKEIKTDNGDTIATKQQVQAYIEANKNYQTAKTNFDTATKAVTTAQGKVDELNASLKNIDNSGDTEENKTTAKDTIKKQLDDANQKLAVAKQKEQEAKTALDTAKNALVGTGVKVADDGAITKQAWQQNIDKTLDDLQKAERELAKMKATQKTNAEQLAILQQELSALETQKAGAIAAHNEDITNQVIEKGELNTKISNAGAKYTTADQNDGNWWKRNMPKWLGGSSKIERTSMKEAHKDKKAAGETLGSYGVDASDYSISNQAEQKTTKLYNRIEHKGNFPRKKAIKYFEDNPTATIDDAIKYLKLS